MVLAAAVLVAAMVGIMASRVAGPFGKRMEGPALLEYRLGLPERLVLHRHSIYALGAVLLLGALTGAIPRAVELVGILGAFAVVLGLPVGYRLTRDGVGLNAVVFRSWSELAGVEETRRGLRLRGQPGLGDFSIVCLRAEPRQALRRLAQERIARGRVEGPSPGRDRSREQQRRHVRAPGRPRASA